MPQPGRQDPSTSLQEFAHALLHDHCPRCEQLLDELNVAYFDVHNFILEHYDRRADDELYLGELGRLIHAQVTARRQLIDHQDQQHANAVSA